MLKKKFFLSNLNAILFFVGFPLFTTFFYGSGEGGDTSYLTISYRLFTFAVVVILIFLHKRFPPLNSMGKLLLFYWLAYLVRILFDIYVRADSIFIPTNQKLLIINTTVITCFAPLIALFFSYKHIQWRKVFFIIVLSLIITTLYGIINKEINTGLDLRATMNRAQNTLSFGFYSAATFLAGLTLFNSGKEYKGINKTISIVIMIIGFFGIGIAGSRGPLVGLVFAIFLGPMFKLKPKYVFSFIIITMGLYIFKDSILNYLSDTFYLTERMMYTLTEGDTSGRESYYADAIAQIKKYPLLGDWHLLYYKNGVGNTAHNAFLTSWMGLGVIIGSFIVVLYGWFIKKAIQLINARNIYSFIGYIVLLSIGYSLTTGGVLPHKDTFNFAFGMLILTTLPQSSLYYRKHIANNYIK